MEEQLAEDDPRRRMLGEEIILRRRGFHADGHYIWESEDGSAVYMLVKPEEYEQIKAGKGR